MWFLISAHYDVDSCINLVYQYMLQLSFSDFQESLLKENEEEEEEEEKEEEEDHIETRPDRNHTYFSFGHAHLSL